LGSYGLKQSGWLDEKKENPYSHFIDILYEINLGIFKIEKLELEIITQITSWHKEILGLFNIEPSYFTNFNEAKKVVSLL